MLWLLSWRRRLWLFVVWRRGKRVKKQQMNLRRAHPTPPSTRPISTFAPCLLSLLSFSSFFFMNLFHLSCLLHRHRRLAAAPRSTRFYFCLHPSVVASRSGVLYTLTLSTRNIASEIYLGEDSSERQMLCYECAGEQLVEVEGREDKERSGGNDIDKNSWNLCEML